MADPNAALRPDFNPAKLTIPALRGVLLEFAPETLSSLASAKKADLVRAYNEHVLPQAPRLLAERLAVRADGTAIQRVHNAPQTSSDGAVPLPAATRKRAAPPAKTTARAKRASSRQPSVVESEDGAGASTSKRTRRAPAKRDLSDSETDEAPPEPKRRTKAARREPSVVEEPVEVRHAATQPVLTF